MKILEFYISLKLIWNVIIPVIVILIIMLWVIKEIVFNSIKNKIILKNGFVYDEALGSNASYEFQPRYIKGTRKIRAKDALNMSLKELKKWINKE
jgi:hypothetical protein